MDIAKARQAGELAASIDARTEKLGAVDAAIAGSWRVISCRARDQESGREIELVMNVLDAETSAQALQFVRGIYQAQVDALNEQLTAIENSPGE